MTLGGGPYTGRPLRRREDERLLRGRGRFVADLSPPGLLQAYVLRSPHAHARILNIDRSRALPLAGVVTVLTAADLGAANRPLPNRFPHAAMHHYPQYPLAREKVHYVGEPVAVVVAETRYVAEDAAELVDITYEPLPPVVDMEAALRADAALVHDDQGAPDNLAARFAQQYGDVDAAFAGAHLIVEERLVLRKCAGVPIECRGITASLDDLGRLVVSDATQTPHMIRDLLAAMLDRAPHEIRVIPPDVGGGFGVKAPFYPEELLIPYLAQSLGRPVQWLEDRRENLLASIQERGQAHTAAMALDRDGRILGVRDRFVADSGSFCAWGIVVPLITSTMIPGAYRVPAYRCEVEVVYTNTCPLAPYRGAGRPQATFVMERLLDQAARALGIDRAEIRFRNLVQPQEFPYAVGLHGRDGRPLVYDSGDYPACLSRALALVGADGFAAEQAAALAAGRRLGLGMAVGVENTGLGPHEGTRIRVDPGPRVVVYTGACSQGQGHLTAFSQLAADVLTVRPDQVMLVGGDTDGIPYGTGTFASRSAVNAGNAVVAAAERVKAQALRLGAQALEASVEDVELRDGAVRLKGLAERLVSLSDLAHLASAPFPGQSAPVGFAVGLEATEYFMPSAAAYSSSAHTAVVEVDPTTGRVRVERYAIVHDCGNVINPLIVEGQVLGGFAAGLGNALYEEVVYAEDGQLLTGSLMDYLLPTTAEVPPVLRDQVCTPSPLNPLGLKGVGESATIPVPACITNAVADALGVAANESPLSPARVRALARPR